MNKYNGINLRRMFSTQVSERIETFFNKEDQGDNYVMVNIEGMKIIDASQIDNSLKYITTNGLKIKLYIHEVLLTGITLEKHINLYNSVVDFDRDKVPVQVKGGYTCATFQVDKNSFISNDFLGSGEQDEYLSDPATILERFEEGLTVFGDDSESEDFKELTEELLEFKEFLNECGYIENVLLLKSW